MMSDHPLPQTFNGIQSQSYTLVPLVNLSGPTALPSGSTNDNWTSLSVIGFTATVLMETWLPNVVWAINACCSVVKVLLALNS